MTNKLRPPPYSDLRLAHHKWRKIRAGGLLSQKGEMIKIGGVRQPAQPGDAKILGKTSRRILSGNCPITFACQYCAAILFMPILWRIPSRFSVFVGLNTQERFA